MCFKSKQTKDKINSVKSVIALFHPQKRLRHQWHNTWGKCLSPPMHLEVLGVLGGQAVRPDQEYRPDRGHLLDLVGPPDLMVLAVRLLRAAQAILDLLAHRAPPVLVVHVGPVVLALPADQRVRVRQSVRQALGGQAIRAEHHFLSDLVSPLPLDHRVLLGVPEVQGGLVDMVCMVVVLLVHMAHLALFRRLLGFLVLPAFQILNKLM